MKGIGNKTEISVRGQDRLIISTPNQRNEKATQNMSSPEATTGSAGGYAYRVHRRIWGLGSAGLSQGNCVPRKPSLSESSYILKKSNYKGSYFNRREWLRDQRALLIVTMIVIFPIGI